jgi:RNA polymerase sigma factor (sigma-70 family)
VLTPEQQKVVEDHMGYAERIARYEVPHFVRDRLGHEEVLALCYFALVRAVLAWRGERDFLPLAKTAMKNMAMTAYKRDRYQRQWAALKDDDRPLAELCIDCRKSDVEKGWLVEAMEVALAKLRPRQRAVLRQHYLEGKGYKELGVGADNCGLRALARLRKLHPDGI